jgi:hypothetical protein
MRLATTIVVAAAVLWGADASLNDGRYTDVAMLAVKHIALSMGFHI